MTLQQMKYMVSAANHRSFSKAARECFVAQTAISKQIANLEKELNCQLFIRNQHQVELTKQGEIFLSYAKDVLQLCDYAIRDIHMSQLIEQKRLKVGYKGHIERRLLTEIAVEFSRLNPDIFLTYQYVILDNVIPSLITREQDVIFAPYEHVQGAPHISNEHLLSCPINLVVSDKNPLSALEVISRETLKSLNFIAVDTTSSPGLCAKSERQWAQLGFRPNITYNASELESALLMVESDAGVMLMPRFLEAFEPRNLRYIPIEGFRSSERISIAWLSSNNSPETLKFIKFVSRWFKERFPDGRSEF